MSVAAPQPVSFNPWKRLVHDLRIERGWDGSLPPGPRNFSVKRTRQAAMDPLPLLLDCYREYGPVFSMRILHASGIFMLGPAANHYVLVENFNNFRWREGGFIDLIPLLGDGMLTIDGSYHKRARRIMLPAFHRDRIAAAQATMVEETERALSAFAPDAVVDVYHWTRELALRIAMRALFGFDPDRSNRDLDVAEEFERALSYYGRDFFLQSLRGPRTPWKRMHEARRLLDRVIYEEIARRRAEEDFGEDVLSLLMQAEDEDGSSYSDRELRDQLMTLLFAGHDTTTSTVTFLFYELARHPRVTARLLEEQDEVLGDRPPEAADVTGEAMPQLEMAIDETLRLYPPAWVGPRRCVESFEFGGYRIPGGVPVNYCSWASHRLPDVFPEPEAFVPERFSPEEKAKLPRGAYVPFGGGSRTCIGMRFGQMEIRTIALLILQRCRLGLLPGHTISIRQMPTLSPRGGLPMLVLEREAPLPAAAVA
jgi:cytochrome P450